MDPFEGINFPDLRAFGWMAVILIIAIIIAFLVLLYLILPFLLIIIGVFLLQMGQKLYGGILLTLGIIMFLALAINYAGSIRLPRRRPRDDYDREPRTEYRPRPPEPDREPRTEYTTRPPEPVEVELEDDIDDEVEISD